MPKFFRKIKKNHFLWIPRLLIIFVGYFYFYILLGIIISGNSNGMHYYLFFHLFNLIALSLIMMYLSNQELISGILLVLYSLYGYVFWGNINSFKYCLLIPLAFAGVLLILFPFFSVKSSDLQINHSIDQKTEKNLKIRNNPYLLIIIPLIFCMNILLNHTFANTGYTANGPSMIPTIQKKSIVMINKLVYIWQEPKRGDIISIKMKDYDYCILKRIIGLPKETVEWKDYNIYINGKLLHEPYQYDFFTHTFKQTNQFDTVELKEDEYFVMGDNRNYSGDSRKIGPIHREDIIGKVYFIHNSP